MELRDEEETQDKDESDCEEDEDEEETDEDLIEEIEELEAKLEAQKVSAAKDVKVLQDQLDEAAKRSARVQDLYNWSLLIAVIIGKPISLPVKDCNTCSEI